MAPNKVGTYLLFDTIGEGSFGKVKVGIDETTGEEVAIKILNRSKMDENQKIQVQKEIAIMKALAHPNLVHLHKVFANSRKYFLVLDLVKGGELCALLDKPNFVNGLPESVARYYFKQLVEGVLYCHERGVYHRDLKPENLLLTEDGKLKITDFGLGAITQASVQESQALLQTRCGTPNYAPPEVIEPPPEGYKGSKCDAWSIGVILYVLLTASLPFDSEDIQGLFNLIFESEPYYPSTMSKDAKDLTQRLLRKNPQQRISLIEVTRHPWYNKMDDQDGIAKATSYPIMANFQDDLPKKKQSIKSMLMGPLDPNFMNFKYQRSFLHSKPVLMNSVTMLNELAFNAAKFAELLDDAGSTTSDVAQRNMLNRVSAWTGAQNVQDLFHNRGGPKQAATTAFENPDHRQFYPNETTHTDTSYDTSTASENYSPIITQVKSQELTSTDYNMISSNIESFLIKRTTSNIPDGTHEDINGGNSDSDDLEVHLSQEEMQNIAAIREVQTALALIKRGDSMGILNDGVPTSNKINLSKIFDSSEETAGDPQVDERKRNLIESIQTVRDSLKDSELQDALKILVAPSDIDSSSKILEQWNKSFSNPKDSKDLLIDLSVIDIMQRFLFVLDECIMRPNESEILKDMSAGGNSVPVSLKVDNAEPNIEKISTGIDELIAESMDEIERRRHFPLSLKSPIPPQPTQSITHVAALNLEDEEHSTDDLDVPDSAGGPFLHREEEDIIGVDKDAFRVFQESKRQRSKLKSPKIPLSPKSFAGLGKKNSKDLRDSRGDSKESTKQPTASPRANKNLTPKPLMKRMFTVGKAGEEPTVLPTMSALDAIDPKVLTNKIIEVKDKILRHSTGRVEYVIDFVELTLEESFEITKSTIKDCNGCLLEFKGKPDLFTIKFKAVWEKEQLEIKALINSNENAPGSYVTLCSKSKEDPFVNYCMVFQTALKHKLSKNRKAT